MLLDPSPEQESLRETTCRFLANEAPLADVRKLREHPDGFERSFWRRGAELGWVALLAAESAGGGSVSGQGLVDLTLIAHEFGRHAAPGPLLPTNLVAAALSTGTGGAHEAVLAGLVDGSTIAAWCAQEPPGERLEILGDGGGVVVNGTARPVEAAGQAEHLLVAGRTNGGTSQVLVPRSADGVTVVELDGVDLTRRFYSVSFDGVRLPLDSVVGAQGEGAGDVERLFRIAAVLACAESVGAMERAFEMTVDWAFDRYSFGRPLASYQALKHRFADMKSWLEAAHAITDTAAVAVGEGRADAAEQASAAKAFVGHYGAELMQDCVQLHGGIGVTFDHDLHLFLRRVTLQRTLFGTPADHRARLGEAADG
jgi:alkylation response protein AidB-like acyl-CoA dehydrogenase